MNKIYSNQKKCSESILELYHNFLKSQERFKIVGIPGKLQEGKTGVLQYFTELLDEDQNEPGVVATTTYRSTEIFNQFYSDFDETDCVRTFKMTTFKNDLQNNVNNLYEEMMKSDVLIVDEFEYGIGVDSCLEYLFECLNSSKPELDKLEEQFGKLSGKRWFIVVATATPITLLSLQEKMKIPVTFVKIDTGGEYTGIEEFYKSDKFFNTEHINSLEKIHNDIYAIIDKSFDEYKNGYWFIRASGSTSKADDYEIALKQRYKKHIDNGDLYIRVVHSDKSGSTEHQVNNALKLGKKRRTLIIVVGSLQAGFRMSERRKDKIRFVWETFRKSSSAIQGLVGRACGYHKNIPYVCAPKLALEEYIEIHRCINEDEFYVPGKNASTHTETKGRDEVFIPCEIVKDYPTVDRDAIEKNLNIGRNEYFFSTSNSKKHFQKQWKESEEPNPNFKYVTWFEGYKRKNNRKKVRDYHFLTDLENNITRVVQKIGNEEIISKGEFKTTSFLQDF